MKNNLKTTGQALKPFLQHHANRAKRGEITNAIRNCHVHGLHSIMLHDEGPGNRIRMFYADSDNELWRNEYSSSKLSLAVHQHHCDVTLQIIEGTVFNTIYQFMPENWKYGFPGNERVVKPHITLDEYIYESAILGAAGSLSPTGRSFGFWRQGRNLASGPESMNANTLHTVGMYRDQQAAWLVYEGKEGPDYQSICYTNNPVFDPSNMYISDPSVAKESFEWLGF